MKKHFFSCFFPLNCFREWKVVFFAVKNVASAKKILRNRRRFSEREN